MGKFSKNIIANCLISCATYNHAGRVVAFGQRRVTWSEMWKRAGRIASALIDLGVKKDDKVTFMFHNTPEFVELNYGIQVAGAVPVPMNYRFMPGEIEYQANHSDAEVFIYDSLFAESVEKAAPRLEGIRKFICHGKSGLDGALDYEEFVNSGREGDPGVETGWEDVAVMVYTGGTTGFPKGVMLTYGAHRDMFSNLLAYIITRAAEVDMDPEQAKKVGAALPVPGLSLAHRFIHSAAGKRIMESPGVFNTLRKGTDYLLSHPEAARIGYKNTIGYIVPSMPFFHDASYQILILSAFLGNICFVLPDSLKFDPELILRTVEKEKPLFMANVPTGWKKLVSFPEIDKYDTSSVRIAASGAGACPVELKRKIFEKFPGVIIADLFGQTEMTPVTSFRIDASPDTLKERSVGKSIVEAKVVDEEGRDVPPGEIGEILYKSSTVMKGYYKDEEKTSEVMKDGWFRGGDLGYIDEEGEVRLIDRKKECINTGGEKVFPLEVEQVIHEHPKVEDVCIIGVPDEEWGSTVRAVVQMKKGEQAEAGEIIEFCKDKLAGYKVPRSVVFVDELPLSPVGKVLRAKIREMYGAPI